MRSRLYVYGSEVSSVKVKKETARYKPCNVDKQSCGKDILPEGVVIECHFLPAVHPSTSAAEDDNCFRGTSPLDRILSTDPLIQEQQIVTRETNLYDPNSHWDSSNAQYYLFDTYGSSSWNFGNCFLIPSRLPTPSSQFEADASCVISGFPDFHVVLSNGTGWKGSAIPADTISLFRNLESPMFYEFRVLCRKIGRNINHSVGKTMPLLPWNAKQDIQKSSIDMVVLKQILFLLMNNFAGSNYAVFDALFEQIRHFSVSQMQNILDAVPAPYMSAIQQSILTIAIKSNVPRIVQILLERGLDADRVTCRFAHSTFTPLGLACEFGHMDIAIILIKWGVDVNRNYPDNAMKRLLGIGNKYSRRVLPSATCDIFRCLLVAGARIDSSSMLRPEFWKDKSLVDTFVQFSKLPVDKSTSWTVKSAITSAVRYCGLGQAVSAIKKILGDEFYLNSCDPTLVNVCRGLQERAAYEGNKDLIDFLLKAGFIPDRRCLCEAVRGNQHHIVQSFCEAGMNLDCEVYGIGLDFNESHEASYLSYGHQYAGYFPADVDPHLLEDIYIRYHVMTPFAEAIRCNHQDMIHMFQNQGIFNTMVPAGDTFSISEKGKYEAALSAAAESGNLPMVNYMVELLVKAGMIIELSNVIDLAVLGNHMHIVEALMSAGIKPSPYSVTMAILVHNADLTRLFLDTSFSYLPGRALYYAVRWGNITVAKELLLAGVEHRESAQDTYNNSSWHIADLEDRLSPLAESILRRDHNMTRTLMDEGVDLNIAVDKSECSPLTVAIQNEDEPLIHELLARGADPNDSKALLEACASSTDIVGVILDAFRQRYPAGDKHFASLALERAIEDEDETLVDRLAGFANLQNTGSKQEIRKNRSGQLRYVQHYERPPTLFGEAIATRNVNIVRILLARGADVNSTTIISPEDPLLGRLTAILQAISISDLAMVKLLYDHGADIHFIPTLGIRYTSLQLAVKLGHTDIIYFLLDHGVDVNARSCIWGAGTALQLAAGTGYVGIAELLIQHGAKIDAPGSKYQGKTAFESAAENGRVDMLLMLYHKGTDLVSDGGEQVRRAKDFAEKNGQIAAKDLVEELAEAARSRAIVGYRGHKGGAIEDRSSN